MTGLPLVVVVAREAAPEMEVSGPTVCLGVCSGSKHLRKGEEGSRSGQKRSFSAAPARDGLSWPLGSRVGMPLQMITCCANTAQSSQPCTDWWHFIFIIFYFQLEKLRHRAVAICPILEEIGPELKPNPTTLCCVMCWAGSWGEWMKGNLSGTERCPPQSALAFPFIHSFTQEICHMLTFRQALVVKNE